MKFLFVNNPPYIAYGIAAGLKQIGQDIKVLPLWMSKWNEQKGILKKSIEEFRPDYIFADGDPPNLNWEAVYYNSEFWGIPLIYWATEDPLWHREVSLLRSRSAEYVFTTSEELIPEYHRQGKKAALLLFACNPYFHRKIKPSQEFKCDVIFVGSNYEQRADKAAFILQPLMKEGFNLKVFGHWWTDKGQVFRIPDKYYGGFVPYDKLPLAYNSAKIVLGMHLDDTSLTQTSMRTYEALGCGSFYLTQYTKAHEYLFKKGIHLEWVLDSKDIVELVRYYLKNDVKREKIAGQGQTYVYMHHSVSERAHQVVNFLQK